MILAPQLAFAHPYFGGSTMKTNENHGTNNGRDREGRACRDPDGRDKRVPPALEPEEEGAE